jgi:small redox-active disulfide protein 2
MEPSLRQVWVGTYTLGLRGLDEILASVQGPQVDDVARITPELLDRVREQNHVPESAEQDYGEALYREDRRFPDLPVEEDRTVSEIRILGPGCCKCEEVSTRIMAAVAEPGLTADVQHITELKEMAGYGPVPTPALVVNDEIRSMGRAPTLDDIKKLLAPSGASPQGGSSCNASLCSSRSSCL